MPAKPAPGPRRLLGAPALQEGVGNMDVDDADDDAIAIEDPFFGLPAADGPSLFAEEIPAGDDVESQSDADDDDDDGDENAEAAADAAPASAAPAAKEAGATDEAHLPPWMRTAHASIIHPSTPSASSLEFPIPFPSHILSTTAV